MVVATTTPTSTKVAIQHESPSQSATSARVSTVGALARVSDLSAHAVAERKVARIPLLLATAYSGV